MRYTTVLLLFVFAAAWLLMPPPGSGRQGVTAAAVTAASPRTSAQPGGWQLSPRELDLGYVGPGRTAEGSFTIAGSGVAPEWSTRGPDGWSRPEGQELVGSIDGGGAELKVQLFVQPVADLATGRHQVSLTLQHGYESMVCQRDLPAGSRREALRIDLAGAGATVFIRYRIIGSEGEPLLAVSPLRLDLGRLTAGQQASKVVRVRNAGGGSVRWRVEKPANGRAADGYVPGRYVAFANEAVRGTGVYAVSPSLREVADFSGAWGEKDGWPRVDADAGMLRYRFWGTGVSVLLRKAPWAGNLIAFVDDGYAGTVNGRGEDGREAELPIAEGLPEGSHVLTLTARDGGVVLEGVKVYGVPLQRAGAAAMRLFPDSGAAQRETDYVNVVVNGKLLRPGCYDELIVFESNGGREPVEVSFEVASQTAARALDVYRYAKGSDYLYTSTPQAEARALSAAGYVKQGIAFRLFTAGTPGTTEFYRWRSGAGKGHFYSYDPAAGRSLNGYVLEGAIGNIATSQLTGTRPLYRWFNPRTGSHFYSTDVAGEGNARRGYRFEGIAGYVR